MEFSTDVLAGLDDGPQQDESALLDPATLELVKRLDKALKKCSESLGQRRVRALTDLYYQIQRVRIATNNQAREADRPTQIFSWLADAFATLELDIQHSLRRFVRKYRSGNWMLSICGVGPVIAAGLLSHLDVRRAKTVGHYWAFAGLTDKPWEKGQLRPWNQRLKNLCCYKLGESFVKVQGRETDIYGKIFKNRKNLEIANTQFGEHHETAAIGAARCSQSTIAWLFYAGKLPPEIWGAMASVPATQREKLVKASKVENGVPMLPPAHLHARARRYAVKLFLSHLHHVQTVDYWGRIPPLPYPFERMPDEDHRHFVQIPNWSVGEGSAMWPDNIPGDELGQLFVRTAAEPVVVARKKVAEVGE